VIGSDLVVFRLDNVAADAANLLQKRYRMVVSFALIWREPVSEAARQFIGFIYSAVGEKIICDFGVVPAS